MVAASRRRSSLATQRFAAEQYQQGPQAFAAGRRDIVADLRYQRHARGQLLLDDLVDGAEIISYRAVEGLGLHRLLHWGCAAC